MARARQYVAADDAWLTTKEAARRLGFTADYLYRMGDAGPPRYKLGGQWRYLRSALDNWALKNAK